MRVLAVDPGFERVGIAIIQKNTHTEDLLYSDCFTTSPKDEFPDRLYAISTEILKIIKLHKPHVLATETLFFNTNQKTAMRVAEARGVIINSARSCGLDVFEYTPLQIKIAITGYGKADKKQVADMVMKLISMDNRVGRKDDEFDAIAIGLTHCAHKKIN